MKINGQEVDMQKVVAQYEREHPIKTKKKNAYNQEWWNSQAGMIHREKMSDFMRSQHENKNIHRQKIKYILTDSETEEEFQIEGQDKLADFLGYKKFNSSLRNQMLSIKQLSNKSKTKIYNVKETI